MHVTHFYTYPVIALLIWAKFVHTEPPIEQNVDECVQMQLTSRPKLKDRFDIDLLREACRKKAKWLKMALAAAETPETTPALSPSQSAWADKVYQCFELKCMCEMYHECKEELARVDFLPRNTSTEQFRNARSVTWRNVTEIKGYDTLTKIIRSDRPRKKRAISPTEKLLLSKIGKGRRKEIRRLTDSERYRFFAALQTLKTQKIDDMSKYDIMIVQHTAEKSPGAHFSAAFLPFHREFLKNLEVAMRSIDPKIALPYWDSTMDVGLPEPRDSVLWSGEFMGNGFGDVKSGPFGNWTTLTDAKLQDLSPNKRIVRNIGVSRLGSLYSDKDIEDILNRTNFGDLVYCKDPFFELVHGATHLWIGGHMTELRISPNDPIFFLIHGFVDYLWESWRQLRQNYDQRSQAYPSDAQACNQFAYGQAKMRPYSIKNIDGISNQYTDVLYSYEPRPKCSRLKPDCQSQYLFCHIGKEKCFSKVKMDGNCSGLEHFDSCAGGICQAGRCKPQIRETELTTEPPEIKIISVTPPARPLSKQGTVWIPITVLQLDGRSGTGYSNAKIITTEEITSDQWIGKVADPSQKPYYTGAAFAQVRNPFLPRQSSFAKAKIEVFDAAGRKCDSMCHGGGSSYRPCEVSINLLAASQQPDGTAFAANLTLAKSLNWVDGKHQPDQYLFLYKLLGATGRSRASPSPASHTQPPTTLSTFEVLLINQPATTQVPPIPPIQTDLSGTTTASFLDNIFAHPTGPPLFQKMIFTQTQTRLVERTVTEFPINPSNAASIPLATPSVSVSVDGNDRNDDSTGVLIQVHKNKEEPTLSTTPIRGAPGPAESAHDDCRNDHRCCSIWAENGECPTNPFVKVSCRNSCAVCKPMQSRRGCVDLHPRCGEWTNGGQCDSNSHWMEENCKRSCEICHRSVSELKSLCGSPPEKDFSACIDHDPQCVEWAKNWECINNPWWMKDKCPASCNYCSTSVIN